MEREEIVKALRGECDDCSGLSDDGCRCDLPIYCPNRDAADLIEQQATRIAELEDKLQKAMPIAPVNIERYDNGQGRCPLCETDIPFQVVNDKWAFELYCPHCGVRMNLKDDAK